MWKTFTGKYPTEPLCTYEQSRTDFVVTEGFKMAEGLTEDQETSLRSFYTKVFIIDTDTKDLLDADCYDHNGAVQNGKQVEAKCQHTYNELKNNNRNVYI